VLTGVTLAVAYRQRRLARFSELALIELQDRVAGRLGIDALRFHQGLPEKFTPRTTPSPILPLLLPRCSVRRRWRMRLSTEPTLITAYKAQCRTRHRGISRRTLAEWLRLESG
jgi:hypothetical protein